MGKPSAFPFLFMRYHYKKPSIFSSMYGEVYTCDHPVYNCCTLFKMDTRGLSVIQQRFDPERKMTLWSEIDPWLTDSLYLRPNFKEFLISDHVTVRTEYIQL